MTGEQKISYSEGLMDIATDLYARAHIEKLAQLPGVRAKLLRQSVLCRTLAEIAERAEKLQPSMLERSGNIVRELAAGFDPNAALNHPSAGGPPQ